MAYTFSLLGDASLLRDACESLDELAPVWLAILCFREGYGWKQSRGHFRGGE